MTIGGVFELVAWALSAVIAAWLILDVLRVSRRYDEDTLINPGEAMETSQTDPVPGQQAQDSGSR
jgi:hypothetical protein